ncbi:ABC transporter ATP-binding protein [Glaciimonas sp. PCH181]|uniref:dipeptide ABC transporter ATP-binding protein n=1 Tax=Glaciimonas sp. PCH181 TaxID=2133943 RepID=UPI0013750C73|nr:ABC transporter ATP-binding protein [Glaciimonas sp. PCH181]
MNVPLLEIKDLRVAFGQGQAKNEVLHGINLTVNTGEIVGWVGESGSGKSVTAMSVLQLLGRGGVITSGSIKLNGRELVGLPEKQLRALRGAEVSMIFQDATTALNPCVTVGKQIADVIKAHQPMSKPHIAKEVNALLEKVGISAARCVKLYPHELSGGMRQRVMIAMAIACKPQLILADEPTTALDVTVQAQIVTLLRNLVKDSGISLVFITHNLDLMAELCDRAIVMRHGHILEEGGVEDIVLRPKHEYTQILFRSVPRLTASDKPPEVVAAPEPILPFLLDFQGVTKSYPVARSAVARIFDRRRSTALNQISLSICEGEAVGIVGESGSGKSTMARMVTKLFDPTIGKILFRGQNIADMRGQQLHTFRNEVQMVFQSTYASLNPRKTIATTLLESIGDGDMTLEELLRLVQLPVTMGRRYPHQLSGGQRQRVCIARAIARKPRLLVADEPTSALDVSVQAEIIELLRNLRAKTGVTLVVISHDLAMVNQLCDRVVVMSRGSIVEQGPADEVLSAPSHTYTKELLEAIPKGLSGRPSAIFSHGDGLG